VVALGHLLRLEVAETQVVVEQEEWLLVHFLLHLGLITQLL
jgi:hypothetical protein